MYLNRRPPHLSSLRSCEPTAWPVRSVAGVPGSGPQGLTMVRLGSPQIFDLRFTDLSGTPFDGLTIDLLSVCSVCSVAQKISDLRFVSYGYSVPPVALGIDYLYDPFDVAQDRFTIDDCACFRRHDKVITHAPGSSQSCVVSQNPRPLLAAGASPCPSLSPKAPDSTSTSYTLSSSGGYDIPWPSQSSRSHLLTCANCNLQCDHMTPKFCATVPWC